MFKILGQITLVLGVSFIFFVLSLIVLEGLGSYSDVFAAAPDEIKSYIQSKVDDQTDPVPPNPGQGPYSFGKYLWGLAGCESTWNERNIDPTGTFYGLYQYDQVTWQNVNSAM